MCIYCLRKQVQTTKDRVFQKVEKYKISINFYKFFILGKNRKYRFNTNEPNNINLCYDHFSLENLLITALFLIQENKIY